MTDESRDPPVGRDIRVESRVQPRTVPRYPLECAKIEARYQTAEKATAPSDFAVASRGTSAVFAKRDGGVQRLYRVLQI